MKLSRYTIKNITNPSVTIPDESVFELPEKVLQFGTGVLLRGLPDYFIDKANRQGIFNGRVVVVKSTAQGDTSAYEKQDGLYTLCVRGVENGKKTEENIINSSISRVLNAQTDWSQVLECAHNRSMSVIISNTTEVGIQLVHEDIRKHPPVSYPGKLLAFLYERFQAFKGSHHSGMVVVPTELIPDNGKKLESIVLELAHLNGLEDQFIEWLEKCNHFCNSLVDRIVPGYPDADMRAAIENELGYSDLLLTVCESYRLWAIEGNDHVKEILSFASADTGLVIEGDIERYRELKLRILNGSHTLSCGLMYLSGMETVKDAMEQEPASSFISELILTEIAPSIPYSVTTGEAVDFGRKVMDRFRNPHIRHPWINITVQYTSKMKMRCIPLLLRYYAKNNAPPELFTLGFAAYLLFTRPVLKRGEHFYGEWNGQSYLVQDDKAEYFYKKWQELQPEALVENVLKDRSLWGEDLVSLPGFRQGVAGQLVNLMKNGIKEAMSITLSKKAVAV